MARKEEKVKQISKISLDMLDLSRSVNFLEDDKCIKSFPFSLSTKLERVKALKGLGPRHYNLAK
jgi:hypothetical protein